MKKLILSILLLPMIAFANITLEDEFAINRLSGAAQKYGLGTKLAKTRASVLCKYSYAVQGGAVGDVNLLRDLSDSASTCVIPDNAVIVNVFTDTITAAAGGSLGFTAVSASDLKTAISASAYSGIQAGVPVSAATAIKLSADKTRKASITNSALSAGVVNLYVDYYLGD